MNGLKTPMPILMALVARAHAAIAGSTPRLNGFSANQPALRPARSAAPACSTHALAERPPCSRSAIRIPLDAAGPGAGTRLGEMDVDGLPVAVLLQHHHR